MEDLSTSLEDEGRDTPGHESRYLRAMMDSAGEAFIGKTLDGIINAWNPAAERLLGYSAQEMIGKPAELITPAALRKEEHRLAKKLALGEGVGRRNTQRIAKNGSVIDVSVISCAIRNDSGRVIAVSEIFADASDRQRLEAAELARAFLSAVVDSADDAIITQSLDGTIISWNRGAEKLFGFAAEEATGHRFRELMQPVHAAEELRILERLSAGEQIDHHETQRGTKDGRIVDISLNASPIRNGEGKIVGISRIMHDITERKRIEEFERIALAHAYDAKQQAEALNRSKDEFIATVSHELRTPMTAILGWVRMLRTGQLSVADQRKAVAVIERNAKSQAQLIEDLLDISRIVSGKLKLEIRTLDFASVIGAAVEGIRPAAEAKSISVETKVPVDLGSISGDPERLQQLVWNLLSNAVKFTPSGGLVRVTAERGDGEVVLSVSDSGIGISPEFLPYVFNRFTQADSSITRMHGGLGMGLSIVKSIAELHGGTVAAFSPGPQEGSTFVVKLPQRHDAGAGEAAAAQAENYQNFVTPEELSGLALLVVDDDADTCDMLKTILQRCESTVRTATSGAEALHILDLWQPDVIICDIGMPEMDGYEFIRRVRFELKGRKSRTPAIALTALARIEDRIRALSAGFQMHVAKPVEPMELVNIVASLASLRRQRRAG